jgi:hypothetical protein
MNVHGVCHVWEGCVIALTAWLTYLWADAYPFVTGTTALCGLVLAGHGVYRLAWRIWHGYPTLFTSEEGPPNVREDFSSDC